MIMLILRALLLVIVLWVINLFLIHDFYVFNNFKNKQVHKSLQTEVPNLLFNMTG